MPQSIEYKIAKAVIAGCYGNGADRVKRLVDEGRDPQAIQAMVNRILLDGYTEQENLLDIVFDPSKYDGINLIIRGVRIA